MSERPPATPPASLISVIAREMASGKTRPKNASSPSSGATTPSSTGSPPSSSPPHAAAIPSIPAIAIVIVFMVSPPSLAPLTTRSGQAPQPNRRIARRVERGERALLRHARERREQVVAAQRAVEHVRRPEGHAVLVELLVAQVEVARAVLARLGPRHHARRHRDTGAELRRRLDGGDLGVVERGRVEVVQPQDVLAVHLLDRGREDALTAVAHREGA